MNIYDAWADALESGKYKQGFNALRESEDYFCATGVLCDVIDPDLWSLEYAGDYYRWADDEILDEDYVHGVIFDKVGIEDHEIDQVLFMNDSGESFKKIAAYVRHLSEFHMGQPGRLGIEAYQ